MSVAATAIASPEAYKNAKLMTIPDVDIDKSGKFKYVLIDQKILFVILFNTNS